MVIEGTDGAGKATQVKLLQRYFQVRGVPHKLIQFPRYSGNPYGKIIERYLKGDFGGLSDVQTSLISLAYAGDRFLAKPMIEDWLKQGNLVLSDRYVSSNKAHQSAKLPEKDRQEFIDWLDDLEYNVNGLPREELTLFLYVPSEISADNLTKRQSKDLHEADQKYQTTSADMYLKIAKNEGRSWEVIECAEDGKMRPRQDIHQQIVEILEKRGIIKK